MLEWDQQTYMPSEGGAPRGGHSEVLSRLQHERWTAPEVGGWLGALPEAGSDEVQQAAVRNARRRYERSTRLPARLVGELALARAEGFSAWIKAKEADDFEPFAAPLQRLIDLVREQAERLGAAAHPYDALLEEYDPGATVAELSPMFERLASELGIFLNALDGRPEPEGASLPTLDTEGQKRLSMRILRDLGFDLKRGRLDESEHPFTCGIHPQDVRLTTHLHAGDLLNTLGSTVHECGHGLYEQGLRADWDGTGLNHAAGCGIHESQSRFWENFIGRSLSFCKYLVPRMQGIWPDLPITAEQLYAASNRVRRSLIRVSSDEATYNLHIIVRYELEVALLEGKLQARDLPEAWRSAYTRRVGVTPPDLRTGVLQDVHWSSGYFGYFPSYTVGNLYAASYAVCVERDIPGLWADVDQGRFGTILEWLRERVHSRGHLKDAPELFRDAVGDRDPVEDLVAHLWRRQGKLYGVERPVPARA